MSKLARLELLMPRIKRFKVYVFMFFALDDLLEVVPL